MSEETLALVKKIATVVFFVGFGLIELKLLGGPVFEFVVGVSAIVVGLISIVV